MMRKMGLMAIYQKPRTSVPHPEHRIYPYLLRGLRIDYPDQVWCADITYYLEHLIFNALPALSSGSHDRTPFLVGGGVQYFML